jgi:hypothetical protein
MTFTPGLAVNDENCDENIVIGAVLMRLVPFLWFYA